jgi:hypothetical protein
MRDGAPFSCIPYPPCSSSPAFPFLSYPLNGSHPFLLVPYYCFCAKVCFTGLQNLALACPLNFPLSFLFLHRIAYYYTILMDYVHGRQLRSVNLAVSSFFALSLSPSLSRSVSLLTSQGLPLPCRWPCP